MVIDKLSEINKYTSLHPRFAKAIDYIVTNNLLIAEPGTVLVDGEDIKAIIIEGNCVPEEESLAGFECHNTYIDIQIVLKGKETVGWRARTSCSSPKGEYSEEKDVLFYADAPTLFFEMQAGMFSIYFPEDVHAPMIGEGSIKKLVMKVRVK
ncbi:MAG: YhcH/YjgK/YiaL family protein [Chitinophagaceae bacterium]|nr:YhcH/YjgK/YiaL family protein [Chitinophagaceae bacterium]